MRLPLATLEVFTAIARHGSLRAAADALGLKPSTVSHQLKTLEDQLETALFIRTTRSVSLTEAGRALIRGAGPAFDQLSDAVESARTSGHAARGSLKLAMADHVYDLFISPALPAFCAAYPEIELEFSISDALTDLVDEGLHAGFRIGDKIAQDMVAIRLTPPMPLAVVGSPAYLAQYGTPQTPRALLEHNCIRYRFHSSGRIAPWEFQGTEGAYSVDVRGNLINNTLPASVDLARQGLGLAYTFREYVAPDIAAQTLVPVLESHLSETPGIYVYFPREYRTMMPLRLFMDHLRDSIALR
ncbi:LysR family transcriptional regulator [Phaeobacter sp.]|uniref:LysR family transcriptional regulator n=1 Tax=Phaeobacter sp. TaxID=1902409 RepID=UPI0025FD6F64|nr:LysR family transcriptional regulator [Phaeobacter sp.]